jgi:O-antigen/teichoic acid export membrane protein
MSKKLASAPNPGTKAQLLHNRAGQAVPRLHRRTHAYGSRKMFRKVLLVAYRAFSDLSGKGAFFLITVVAARRLSPQSFGVFSLASALGWIAGVITDFGIQLHVARAVARRPEQAAVILRTWLRVRLWTAGAALLAVAAGLLGGAPDYAFPILLFALLYVGNGLIEFLHYFYRGLTRSDVESSLTIGQRIATLGCALAALVWRPTLTALAAAMLAPAAVTLMFSVWYARRLGREAAVADNASRLPREDSAKQVWSEFRHAVFPIGAGIVLSALYFRIDVFLIQLWRGTDSVGLYNAVFRLVEALRLFPAAVLAVVLPSLCRADDTRPLVQIALAVTAFAITVTVVLWAAAGWGVPLLYGVRYAAAVPAFRILLLSFPLFSLNYALTHQLIGWDGQRTYAVICGLALLANVALNTQMIPALSIEGAAWATLFTEALLTSGCVLALRAHNPRRAARALPATVAS